MSSREKILSGIRRGLKRGPLEGSARDAVEARLADLKRNLIPARGQLDRAGQLRLFREMAEMLDATVEIVDGPDAVPAAVDGFLGRHNLPKTLRMAPHETLEALPWAEKAPLLELNRGAARVEDQAGLGMAFAGVAETGTLVFLSGGNSPATVNFLPDNHVAVLRASDIAGAYEEVWTRIRADREPGTLPRTVNLISGPSRTADIEQMLIKGAHGPRRLHIIIVPDDEAA